MTDHLSREEGRKALQAKKRRKYGNTHVVVDGIRFDSKREATYYAELKIRERAGEVGGIEVHKRFPLLTPRDGVVGAYESDFAFFDYSADKFRIVDVKGLDTPLSRWKRRHLELQSGVPVEIVR